MNSLARSSKLEARSKIYKKILLVRLDRIGDVILSTPAIRAIRDAYPESYIAFMVRPYAAEVVEGNPYLNEIIIYDKEGEQKDLFGNLKFIQLLRKENFDLAIILHPTIRTHIVTSLAGIPIRVGYDRKWGFLLTKRIPHGKQFGLKHEIDYTLNILEYIGVKAKDKTLYVPLKERSERKIDGLFAASGVKKDDTVIAINSGASCISKRWGQKQFAKVGELLMNKYGAKIIIICGPKDKPFGDKVASLLKENCINLSGKTSVSDVASVLKRSRLFISNDSGPVHIACAVGTPAIAIFGRSDRGLSPERWGPSGNKDIILHKYVGCKVCLAHNCKISFKCLEAITVEEVVAAASKILG